MAGRGGRRDRRDDELGPSPVGFGDDVPAFMLLKVRRPVGSTASAEAANHSEG